MYLSEVFAITFHFKQLYDYLTITGKSANVCCTQIPAMMLLFLSGALGSEWNVEYQQQHICAVKGSSVVIPCSFHYPDNQIVQTVLWGHEKSDIFEGPFIFDSNMIKNVSKFEFIGDKQHNCSFKIRQVGHDDAGEYTFRFVTDSEEGKWTGQPGSMLKVVDLEVLAKPDGNRAMKEGDSVGLTCMNSCDDGNLSSALTWFKNRQPMENEGPALYLSNMTSTNSGNYSCSLKRHTETTSGVINIDVEYGPKNTSVSVRPSTEVDAGGNITLICSSQANPPVENYTWFKIDADEENITAVGHQPVFFSGDAGQYFCCATNRHGSQNSSVVTVNMNTHWATLGRVLIVPAVAVLLIVTTVIAVRRLNKKRTKAPETEGEEEEEDDEDIQNADYVNWAVFDKNQSQDVNGCEGAMLEVIYATVDFQTKRESSMEQQMDSVIYSTVCRSQLLNPSYVQPLSETQASLQ